MVKGYDKLSLDHGLLLDLPFREGVGVITRDIARPHHLLTQHDPGGGSFAWGNLATGCPYLEFVTVGFGVGQGVYLDCPAADTLDLDFTSGDYSVGVWVNHADTGHFKPKIVIGRYAVDAIAPITFGDGWEVYLETDTGLGVHYLEHRHHHFSLDPNFRDGCYSTGWTPDSGWAFLGISRSGLYPQHYRNAIPLEMSYSVGGLQDPDTANRDLVIGARYTKDQDWYKGRMWRPRVWGRALAREEWEMIFEMERPRFGV